METKLNIAEILKNKPKGTKLHSSVYGDVKLELITEEDSKYPVITMVNAVCGIEYISFTENGLHYEGYPGAELALFPSSKMRDWSKFAWKKGDILVNRDKNIHLIFEKFIDDTYTIFAGKHCYEKDYRNEYNYERRFDSFKTEYFTLETEDAAQKYLKTIEEKLDGKLNRETLEIEKPQPKFKDGDVLFVKCKSTAFIEIFNCFKNNGDLCNYVSLDTTTHELDISGEYKIFKENIMEIRLATEEEKLQLFNAILAKKDKTWDAEKKQIVDLKPKVELKPFDKVLVRDSKSDKWRVNLYGYKGNDRLYYCVYASWNYCIPYEGNEHLLGTTKNVED